MTHAEQVARAQAALDAAREGVAQSRYRQRYHFMAPAGWINDPNGCIFFQGQYHIFYQHNPYAAVWGPMHWGHAVSDDLLRWRRLPIALAPSEAYDEDASGGCFSGSAVDDGGVLSLLYTGATSRQGEARQAQCLATSADGITFEKYAGNPVIAEPPAGASADFRDPKVFRHGDHWYMVVGSALGEGAHTGEGCAQLYQSDDLREWTYRGIMARSGGRYGAMWECPDFFPLGDKWALIFSPMHCGERKSVYLVGDMDFEAGRFDWQVDGEIDWGSEYYAPQAMRDDKGRTILMAWQNGWDWMPFFDGHGPAAKDGWCGSFAIPRAVSLDAQNRLVTAPVDELAALRQGHREQVGLTLSDARHDLPLADPEAFELSMEIDLAKTTARRMQLTLRASAGQFTLVTVDFDAKELVFNRDSADGVSKGMKRCPLLLEGDRWTLRLFSDTCSIELFADDGHTAMSSNIYPTWGKQQGYVRAFGGKVAVTRLDTWALANTGSGE